MSHGFTNFFHDKQILEISFSFLIFSKMFESFISSEVIPSFVETYPSFCYTIAKMLSHKMLIFHNLFFPIDINYIINVYFVDFSIYKIYLIIIGIRRIHLSISEPINLNLDQLASYCICVELVYRVKSSHC